MIAAWESGCILPVLYDEKFGYSYDGSFARYSGIQTCPYFSYSKWDDYTTLYE